MDCWYFAYGSNLSKERKSKRTGNIRKALVARLPQYRFSFTKIGLRSGEIYANIEKDEQSEVWGVAYLCNAEAIQELDRYEGVSGGHYEHAEVTLELENGEEPQALTYIAGKKHICAPSKPSAEYLAMILNGAREHGLPSWYIRQIESLGS